MNIVHMIAIGLVTAIFNLYLYVLLLRFFMQLLRADYYNPFTLWIVKLAKPFVWPLQKIMPSWRHISFGAFFAVILVEILQILAIVGISQGRLPLTLQGIAYWGAGDLLIHICNIFFFAILIQAIFSWFRPRGSDWISALLYRFTQPLLTPIRRILPSFGGLDLSPLPLLFGFKLLTMYVGYPLIAMGMMWV